MWTPFLKSAEKVSGLAQVIVFYQSDIPEEGSYARSYTVANRTQLKSVVAAEIMNVTTSSTFVDELQTELGLPIDTKVITDPPTPEEQARAKYFQDRAILHTMLDNIGHGIRTVNDQEYLEQLDLVKVEFKPEYEKL